MQTAHAGHITAGGVKSDVEFTEAGHTEGDVALDDALDAAYRRKYARYPGPTASITAAAARETTLRIDPV